MVVVVLRPWRRYPNPVRAIVGIVTLGRRQWRINRRDRAPAPKADRQLLGAPQSEHAKQQQSRPEQSGQTLGYPQLDRSTPKEVIRKERTS